jgi:hypothetical protein
MPFAPLQSNVSKNAMGYALKKVEANVQQQSDISDNGRIKTQFLLRMEEKSVWELYSGEVLLKGVKGFLSNFSLLVHQVFINLLHLPHHATEAPRKRTQGQRHINESHQLWLEKIAALYSLIYMPNICMPSYSVMDSFDHMHMLVSID